ncbi:MAG: hypothetical protein A2Y40_05870 [Candidatus Margulisbacteria bacterium GWF2_35_9]|nr:MAG: hypothetical protein A2Y40_05870 [Candidatus Margulisbacteria bacterium GWF2_35_9]
MKLATKPDGKPYYFFVIDDSRFMCKHISAVITELGGEVVGSALNAADALRLIEQNKDIIDCITCDIVMPGMDGITMLPAIRRINRSIKLIMVSADSKPVNKTKARILGAKHFIIKPLQKEQVLSVFKELFNLTDSDEHIKITVEGKALNVFVVDSVLSSNNLKYSLETCGCNTYDIVSCASDAILAIESLKDKLDLLLIDSKLPDINAFDFVIQMKKQLPDVKIIMMSDNKNIETIQSCELSGVDSILDKPIKTEELYNSIYKLYQPQ